MKAKTRTAKPQTPTILPAVLPTAITTKAPVGTTPTKPGYRLNDNDRHELIELICTATFAQAHADLDKDNDAVALMLAKHFNQPGAKKAFEKAAKAVAHLPGLTTTVQSALRFHDGVSIHISSEQMAEQLGAEAAREGMSGYREGEQEYLFKARDKTTGTYNPKPGFPTEVIVPKRAPEKDRTTLFSTLPPGIQLAVAKNIYTKTVLQTRAREMYNELAQQMRNVTSSQRLIQLWPDLAPVVNQYFANREHVHVPLADIIKKYTGGAALTFKAEDVNKEEE